MGLISTLEEIANKVGILEQEGTRALREALIKGGIPEDIAENYNASLCGGDEWIIDCDYDGDLVMDNFPIDDEVGIIEFVKKREGL